MKTIVAIALTALFIFVAAVQWRAHHASAVAASATGSQIVIHGTPVCVFRQGDAIVAMVGECGTMAAPRDADPADPIPDFGENGMTLPPGHPPVGPGMPPSGNERRILI